MKDASKNFQFIIFRDSWLRIEFLVFFYRDSLLINFDQLNECFKSVDCAIELVLCTFVMANF